MQLTKRDRNKIYGYIVANDLDPREFTLEDAGDPIKISHDSGEIFQFAPANTIHPLRIPLTLSPSHGDVKYNIRAFVPDGISERTEANSIDVVLVHFAHWLEAISLTVGVPDYWAEMRRNQELILGIQQPDSANTPFTEHEQKQIAAQLQEIKEQLREKSELSGEQLERIAERLDEAAEASERMGRKDWLLLFSGIIFTLIIAGTVTPDVADHIFTMAVHGLIHLFTGDGGPPHILA